MVGVVGVTAAGPRIGAFFIDWACFCTIGPVTTLGNRRSKEEKWCDDLQGVVYHVRMSGRCNTGVRQIGGMLLGCQSKVMRLIVS